MVVMAWLSRGHLRLAGWPCHVVQLGPVAKLSADAGANWRVLNVHPSSHCTVVEEDSYDNV